MLLFNKSRMNFEFLQSEMFSILYRLPGHAWVLQVVSSTHSLDPSQSSPPWDGGGLSHCLDLLFSPDPHFLVHSPYSLQSPHVPFTKALIEYKKWFKRHLFIWSIIRNMKIYNATNFRFYYLDRDWHCMSFCRSVCSYRILRNFDLHMIEVECHMFWSYSFRLSHKSYCNLHNWSILPNFHRLEFN